MKCLSIFGLFTVVTMLSCNSGQSNETATLPPAANDNESNNQEMLDANRAVYRAIETGDTVTLRKYITADAIDHGGGPEGGDVKGDDIVKSLASIHNDIDNFKIETLQEAANDDYVFALVHMTGTTNKPVWGMPANYKMDSKSVDVLKVKDMKLVDHWGFMDPAEMMKMMNKPASK